VFLFLLERHMEDDTNGPAMLCKIAHSAQYGPISEGSPFPLK
jgi:hypothetical protein